MKISVRPGKREGWPKVLFDRRIDAGDVDVTHGEVVLTVLADDIYTRNATQRFSIALSPAEVQVICAAARKA